MLTGKVPVVGNAYIVDKEYQYMGRPFTKRMESGPPGPAVQVV